MTVEIGCRIIRPYQAGVGQTSPLSEALCAQVLPLRDVAYAKEMPWVQ